MVRIPSQDNADDEGGPVAGYEGPVVDGLVPGHLESSGGLDHRLGFPRFVWRSRTCRLKTQVSAA